MLNKVGMAALAALGLTLVAAPASAHPLGFGAQLQGAVPAMTEQAQRRGLTLLWTDGVTEHWSDGSVRPGPHAGAPTLLFTDGVTERWSDGSVRPGPHARGNYQGGRGHYREGGHYGARGHYGGARPYGQHRRGGAVMVWTNGVIERWSDGSVRPGPHARHRR